MPPHHAKCTQRDRLLGRACWWAAKYGQHMLVQCSRAVPQARGSMHGHDRHITALNLQNPVPQGRRPEWPCIAFVASLNSFKIKCTVRMPGPISAAWKEHQERVLCNERKSHKFREKNADLLLLPRTSCGSVHPSAPMWHASY